MTIYRYLVDGNPSDIYYQILPYMVLSLKEYVKDFGDYQIVCQDTGIKTYYKLLPGQPPKEIAPQDMTGSIIGSKTIFKKNDVEIDIDNINKRLIFLSSTVDIKGFDLGFTFAPVTEELLNTLFYSVKEESDA